MMNVWIQESLVDLYEIWEKRSIIDLCDSMAQKECCIGIKRLLKSTIGLICVLDILVDMFHHYKRIVVGTFICQDERHSLVPLSRWLALVRGKTVPPRSLVFRNS